MLNKTLFVSIVLSLLIASCQPASDQGTAAKAGMTKVTILYPNGEGKNFDMDYYEKKHMPMLAELFGAAMKTYEIDKGLGGRTPEEPVPFLAIGYLYFDQMSDYEQAFGPNAETILSDIPNYTNIQPIVQISEVVK